ncbi:MAG: hypothetical protein DMF58_09760 [Acidobacteria bacterium]|nr:MAG: hypothetical protein DMF58_09760 [Acidobacteriota bacterium]
MKTAIAFFAAAISWPSPEFVRMFAPRSENASATRVLATAERFGDDLATIRRGNVPPAFLEKHASVIQTLRAQIISNEPPVWALDIDDIVGPPSPPFRTLLHIFAVFDADALAQRNTAAAWADLHAVWILSRSMWQRPDTISIAVALNGSRIIAASRPKIGPPLPAWWSEFKSFDVLAPLLHATEYEAYTTRLRAERYPLGEPDVWGIGDPIRYLVAPFVRPIRIAKSTVAIGKMHEIAMKEMNADPCTPFVIEGMPEWSGFVQRFNDYRCAAR